MKKIIAFFVAVGICATGVDAIAAGVSVKKASPVKKQETSGLDSVTSNSLLPSVIGLVTNVSALNKQQKELSAECVPTDSEIRFVNDLMKEYVKIGEIDCTNIGDACSAGVTYEQDVLEKMPNKVGTPCVPVFQTEGDKKHIWVGCPKAEKAVYCATPGEKNCSSKKYVSTIYTVLGKISFSDSDLLESERETYAKIMEKMEKCAPEKISARVKEAYAGFLKDTITGAGQSTNTATVWDAVSNLTQSSSTASGLQNLAPSVLNLLGQ